jgi:hypothetical protein
MNIETEPQTQEKLPAVVSQREIRVVADSGPLANLLDTARFEHLFRIAEAMSLAPLLPDHLRGNKQGPYSPAQIKGNCFRIVNQAVRWGIDPFSIVDETYVAAGKLAYQGKVIAAVVNAKAPIRERLKYAYSGSKGKDDYTITVSGTFAGEDKPREVTLSVGEAKTDNQMWRRDPEQKLVYSGVIRWARRFTPELMLGVVTEDDIERMEASRAESARRVNDERKVPKPDFDAASEKPSVAPPKEEGRHHTAREQKAPTPPRSAEMQPPLIDEPSQAQSPPSASRENAPPPSEKKSRRLASSEDKTAKDILFQDLKSDTVRANFIEGLKLIEFPGVPADAEIIHELSDITSQAILDEGIDNVFARIRDARWLKNMK